MAEIPDKPKVRPWYRWHVSRWRNSPRVLSMSLAAQGAYRNLLDAAWDNGGHLPNSPEILWRYALASSRQEFEKIASEVMPMFTPSVDGKWLLNETLTSEWNDATEWFKRKSEAGKKGAGARWADSGDMPVPYHTDASAIAVPMAKHGTTPHHTIHNINTKPSAQKPRGPRPNSGKSRAMGDIRHSRIHEMIMNWYQDWAGAQCPWNGADGKQLQNLLTATPGWIDQQFVTCLENLANSPECISRGSPPHEWMSRLPKFLHSPLDRYWKPQGVKNGNGKIAEIKSNISEALRIIEQQHGTGEKAGDSSGGVSGPTIQH